jgi:hypothetical protein
MKNTVVVKSVDELIHTRRNSQEEAAFTSWSWSLIDQSFNEANHSWLLSQSTASLFSMLN